MNNLSNELYLHILSYLWEVDHLEWCGCTRKWYEEILRGHIRKYRFRISFSTTEETILQLVERLYQVIRKPLNQLEISVLLYDVYNVSRLQSKVHIFNRLLPLLNNAVRKAKFFMDGFEILSSLVQREPIQMTELELCYRYSTISEKALIHFLQKISGLQIFSIDLYQCRYHAPYILTVKELTIKNSIMSYPVHESYFTQLEKLELVNCYISDVSMLGSIPDLTLKECHNITDISALNHNRRIMIDDCNGIQDFTRSFEQTEVISITMQTTSSVLLHSEKWKKVKVLTLSAPAILDKVVEIPRTVVKCCLYKDILRGINLAVSPSHALRELSINDDYHKKITSLQGLGFEKLVVIELKGLPQLSSLQGLGSGRNQKVIIRDCPLITDYSPLRYVHEVKIINSKGVVHLDQLDHVHTLTIQAKELHMNPEKTYDQIYELHLQKVDQLHSFQSLVAIPVVAFYQMNLKALEHYLEMMTKAKEGVNQLWNQRIDFIVTAEYRSKVVKRIRGLYDAFLETEYSLLDQRRRFDSLCYRVSLLRRKYPIS